eukprot:1144641-Pelagomonas_calceolata.AAC.1
MGSASGHNTCFPGGGTRGEHACMLHKYFVKSGVWSQRAAAAGNGQLHRVHAAARSKRKEQRGPNAARMKWSCYISQR